MFFAVAQKKGDFLTKKKLTAKDALKYQQGTRVMQHY